MRIYNNNPAFGASGPFEVDALTVEYACEALADEMQPSFEQWAAEAELDREADEDPSWASTGTGTAREDRVLCMRSEFIAGLTWVRTCRECGQDYHADAPERGHAANCPGMGD